MLDPVGASYQTPCALATKTEWNLTTRLLFSTSHLMSAIYLHGAQACCCALDLLQQKKGQKKKKNKNKKKKGKRERWFVKIGGLRGYKRSSMAPCEGSLGCEFLKPTPMKKKREKIYIACVLGFSILFFILSFSFSFVQN